MLLCTTHSKFISYILKLPALKFFFLCVNHLYITISYALKCSVASYEISRQYQMDDIFRDLDTVTQHRFPDFACLTVCTRINISDNILNSEHDLKLPCDYYDIYNVISRVNYAISTSFNYPVKMSKCHASLPVNFKFVNNFVHPIKYFVQFRILLFSIIFMLVL